MHSLGETESQKPAAVQVNEAGGISEKHSICTIEVTNIAYPDLVYSINQSPFNFVGEPKATSNSGLRDKPSELDAQAIFQAKCLKSMFPPPQKHRIVPFVLVSDVKIHRSGT